jgi:nudix-type nucleoside diphosphatase (YffH/AdpP family)
VRLRRLTLALATGARVHREVVERGSAAAVLPYRPDARTALLVRQLRAPLLVAGEPPTLLEVVAGVLDGDDPAACARREAMEEVGVRLGPLEAVGTVWSSPGFTTERVHLYLAPYGPEDRVAEGGGLAAEHEDIEVVEIALPELSRLSLQDGLADMKTLCLVQALRLRRPELFA